MANPTRTRARSTAAVAVEAEATEGAVSFEYDGEKYTVEADALDDVAVVKAYETERIVSVVEMILGPVQFATFMQKKRSFTKDFLPFSEVLFEALGTSSGE